MVFHTIQELLPEYAEYHEILQRLLVLIICARPVLYGSLLFVDAWEIFACQISVSPYH